MCMFACFFLLLNPVKHISYASYFCRLFANDIYAEMDKTFCYPVNNAVNICIVTLSVFILIFCFILFYKGFKFVLLNSKIKTPKIISIPYVITCISCILCVILSIIIMIMSNVKYCNHNGNGIIPYLVVCASFFYYNCILNGYLLYLVRLRLSFVNTEQQISKLKYILLIACYIIAMVLETLNAVLLIFFARNEFNGDINPRLAQIILITGTWIPMIYFISSIVLCVLFVKKSLQLGKNNTLRADLKHRKLGSAVKYLNCVFVTFITTIITTIIGMYFSTKSQKNASFTGLLYYAFVTTAVIDSFFNLFFFHLQFKYMESWYYMICNPFRMEINNIINKNTNNSVVLTTEYDKTKSSNNTNPSSNDTANTDTVSSAKPEGLEPTKTDDESNYARELPHDSDVPNVIINQPEYAYYPHYFCRLCPFQSDYN